jgi:hypothetical protein
MTGDSINNEMLTEVAEMIQIPKVKLRGMKVSDIVYHMNTLLIPINDLSVYENEDEVDTERSREIINYLNERINDLK